MHTVLRTVFKFLYYFFTLRITKVYVISIVIVILSASVAKQYKTFVRLCPISWQEGPWHTTCTRVTCHVNRWHIRAIARTCRRAVHSSSSSLLLYYMYVYMNVYHQ